MYRKLAESLLEQVYFEGSAIVYLNDQKEILKLFLFSTNYPDFEMDSVKDAKEIWLISNHPEGTRSPYQQDIQNIRVLAKQGNGCKVRLFLSSEYFECFEADVMNAGEK